MSGQGGKQFADFDTTVAAAMESEGRAEDSAPGRRAVFPHFRTDLATIELPQQRFAVEQVDVAGAPPHEQKNDSFGETWTMWQRRRNGVSLGGPGCQSSEADVGKSAG
jgi:hypothetical protein